MLIRFWGSRGSLPSPLNYRGVRAKILEAILASRGQSIESAEAIEKFIDTLPFAVRGTYGGNTSCTEIVTGGDEYVLCDMGTGSREFGNSVLAKFGPAKKNRYNIFMSHLALGPLDGISFLHAGLYSRQRHPHPRMPQGDA